MKKKKKKNSNFLSSTETAIIGAQIISNEKQTIEIECQKKLIKCKIKLKINLKIVQILLILVPTFQN